ncbi:hypothetical protein Pogu_1681 [Pyrobaculum oguniense TE7]|uniref:Uncharacterized protein n=1 Tax=Pyrobaculum oguniense (strain DSM 13380 / JCM 10595 / TE7) TaxID=698757 RepID=H6QAT0_PYROT|nr:hypothetical protein Pogu_1681 [Pyrobaculum oguniense TE7]
METLERACRFAERAREAAARAGLELAAAYLVGSKARGATQRRATWTWTWPSKAPRG